MSVRPTYRKRSVVQVLADGMSAHPPKSEAHINVTADADSTPADVPEKLRKLSEKFKEQVEAGVLRDAEGNVVEHVLAPRKFAAGGYVPSPEGENKSCCEEAQLTANEIARRNEELAAAQNEIAELTKALREANDARAEWSYRYKDVQVRAEKAEAERDELKASIVELQPAENRPTLDRDAVEKILSQRFWTHGKYSIAKATDAIMALALAEGWPEWLGPRPVLRVPVRNSNGHWTFHDGNVAVGGNVSEQKCREVIKNRVADAVKWAGILAAIKSEQAATGDEANAWGNPPEVDRLAKLIWDTSRADESTISATGANIVAKAIKDAGWTPPESEGGNE